MSVSDTPRLSIIIATYQAAQHVGRCLQSIARQAFPAWELLVADGASTDGTVEILRQHEQLIAWWRSKRDRGIYDAWNAALPHARGEYVCFLGADDRFHDPGALSRLFGAIGENRYELVTSRGLLVDDRSEEGTVFGHPWDYGRIGRRMIVCHPGLLHRRSLFRQYGLFDTRYRIAGDLAFLLRMPADIRTLHVDTVSVIVQGAGVSNTNILQRLREQREILSRCERYGPVRAWLAWLDKLWRFPVARILNIPY